MADHRRKHAQTIPVWPILLILAAGALLPGNDLRGGTARADAHMPYIETYPYGSIDWHDGFLTASGRGRPPASVAHEGQAREAARRAATITALRNLLRLIQQIRIDADRTVADMGAAPVIEDTQTIRVSGFLKDYQIVDTVRHADNSVTVTVGMSMRGAFSEQILAQVMPPAPTEADTPSDASGTTRVILDVRNSGIQPALLLNIRDAQGNRIIGPLVAGRDYIIQRVNPHSPDGRLLPAAGASGGDSVLILPGRGGRPGTDIVLSDVHAEGLRALLTAPPRLHMPLIVMRD